MKELAGGHTPGRWWNWDLNSELSYCTPYRHQPPSYTASALLQARHGSHFLSAIMPAGKPALYINKDLIYVQNLE